MRGRGRGRRGRGGGYRPPEAGKRAPTLLAQVKDGSVTSMNEIHYASMPIKDYVVVDLLSPWYLADMVR